MVFSFLSCSLIKELIRMKASFKISIDNRKDESLIPIWSAASNENLWDVEIVSILLILIATHSGSHLFSHSINTL